MSSETVRHDGIVSQVDDKTVEVKIVSASACAACHIKSACGIGESKEKTVVLPRPEGKTFVTGQHVTITMSASQGSKAAAIAYFIPFVVLPATLLLMIALGANDILAASVSIASLIPCYLIIYALRGRIEEKFRYVIE